MLGRSAISALGAVALVLVVSACGGKSVTPATEISPNTTVSATSTRVAPQTTPTETAIPPATEDSNTQPESTEPPKSDEPIENSAPASISTVTVPLVSGLATSGLPTIEVVKKLKPSVVQIVTEVAAMGAINQAVPSMGVGTGVVLDKEGFILTNNHVIRDAQVITVTLNNGKTFPAELIGGDAGTDTAVIKIDAEGLQPAVLGKSADLQVGQEVIAIGHALGLPGGPTVSKGVISALGRSIAVDAQTTMVDLIQTDASINPGNSGGPLSNNLGEVIGINTAVIRGSQGIGFAINIDDAQFVVEQLKARGYVDRGFLGISPINLSPALAGRVGVPVSEGIVIVRIGAGMPADVAGLLPEDVIVELGGEPISNTGQMSKFLVQHPPGETIAVVFYRRGLKGTTELTLAERPTP